MTDSARECGAFLRQMREALNITQVELAEQIGVSPAAVARLEGGQVVPAPRLASRIAEVLGTTGYTSGRIEMMLLTMLMNTSAPRLAPEE